MVKNNVDMVYNVLQSIHNECIKNNNCDTCAFYVNEPSENLDGCIFNEVEVFDYGNLSKKILENK